MPKKPSRQTRVPQPTATEKGQHKALEVALQLYSDFYGLSRRKKALSFPTGAAGGTFVAPLPFDIPCGLVSEPIHGDAQAQLEFVLTSLGAPTRAPEVAPREPLAPWRVIGPDTDKRPVLWVSPASSGEAIDHQLAARIRRLGKHLEQLRLLGMHCAMEASKVEGWNSASVETHGQSVCVLDLAGVSLVEIGRLLRSREVRECAKSWQGAFSKLFAKFVVLNAPAGLPTLFGEIKALIPRQVLDTAMLVPASDAASFLLTMLPADAIPSEFGGKSRRIRPRSVKNGDSTFDTVAAEMRAISAIGIDVSDFKRALRRAHWICKPVSMRMYEDEEAASIYRRRAASSPNLAPRAGADAASTALRATVAAPAVALAGESEATFSRPTERQKMVTSPTSNVSERSFSTFRFEDEMESKSTAGNEPAADRSVDAFPKRPMGQTRTVKWSEDEILYDQAHAPSCMPRGCRLA